MKSNTQWRIFKYEEKINQMLLSLVLAIAMTAGTALTSVYAETDTTAQQYIAPDGSIYAYYLDEVGNPYTMIDSEKVYLAIPLEHLRVTDLQKVEELNQAISSDSQGRAIPAAYYDISDNDSTQKINSSVYSADVDFSQTPTFTTSVLKVNRQHAEIRFKTSNVKKENIFAGSKVNFTYFYYDIVEDIWYSQDFTDVDCTGLTGVGMIFSPTITQYLQFSVSRSSKIKSLTVEAWTTGLW